MDLSPNTYFMNFLVYLKYFKVIFFGKMLYLSAFLIFQNKTKSLSQRFASSHSCIQYVSVSLRLKNHMKIELELGLYPPKFGERQGYAKSPSHRTLHTMPRTSSPLVAHTGLLDHQSFRLHFGFVFLSLAVKL